ncbi:MAG: type IV pilus twitching motility protein PilT [Patescibacteria group bacterium]|nr:type IV pilus twitching motility protein PilT [Patescibacteria group bacterium]
MDVKELLSLTVKNNASDLHLIPGIPPTVRVDGLLTHLSTFPVLTNEDVKQMVESVLTPEQKELLFANKELDFSLEFGGGTFGGLGRFRVNSYFQRTKICAAFRFLPVDIRTIEQLSLPKVLHNFAALKQGFVLICGPTGHGKSTTLAAIINEINLNRNAHILTIEDPIEYVYPSGKSIISQREMGVDTHSWTMALKSALREDPDIVLIGEMRDPETIAAAITIAETGHLVFSTLHTNSAAQSIDRIVDSFPPHQQGQIRIQLASTLKGIISQRLLSKINGGRVPAVEILLGNPAVASNIRDGKTHLIDSVIQTSQDAGMITLEASLAQLVLSGAISLDTAKSYTAHEEELMRMLG